MPMPPKSPKNTTSKDSKLVKRILKQVKGLLPSLVKDGVVDLVKLALTNEFEGALLSTVRRLVEENYTSPPSDSSTSTIKTVSYERRIKALRFK